MQRVPITSVAAGGVQTLFVSQFGAVFHSGACVSFSGEKKSPANPKGPTFEPTQIFLPSLLASVKFAHVNKNSIVLILTSSRNGESIAVFGYDDVAGLGTREAYSKDSRPDWDDDASCQLAEIPLPQGPLRVAQAALGQDHIVMLLHDDTTATAQVYCAG